MRYDGSFFFYYVNGDEVLSGRGLVIERSGACVITICNRGPVSGVDINNPIWKTTRRRLHFHERNHAWGRANRYNSREFVIWGARPFPLLGVANIDGCISMRRGAIEFLALIAVE